MHYYSKIKKILSRNETNTMYFIFFLMIINSLLETVSIGALLPLLSIMLESEINNPVTEKIYDLFNQLNFNVNTYYLLVIIAFIYLIKYLFTIYFVKMQSKFLLNLKSDLATRVFSHTIKKPLKYHIDNTSAVLIRNIRQECTVYVVYFLSPLLGVVLSALTITFLVLLLFSINFKATLVIIIILSLSYYLISALFSKVLKKIGKLRQFHEKSIYKYLLQSFRSISEVKMFKLENYYIDKVFSLS